MNYIKSCPNCTYPHSGPWVRCFMCGHDLILAELARLSAELVDDLKAINDSYDVEKEQELKLQQFQEMTSRLDPRAPVWGAQEEYYKRMDREYQQWLGSKWDTDE